MLKKMNIIENFFEDKGYHVISVGFDRISDEAKPLVYSVSVGDKPIVLRNNDTNYESYQNAEATKKVFLLHFSDNTMFNDTIFLEELNEQTAYI